jgi:hypothetical protein
VSNNQDVPYKAGKIKIYPSSFSFKDAIYNISEIQHISFYWEKTFSQGFKFARGQEGARMKMSIQTRRSPKNISSSVSTLYRHDATKFDSFFNGYKHLASTTFAQRYNSYVEELNRNGYFNYDNKKIFKNGNVEWRAIKLNLNKNEVGKGPFFFVIKSGKNLLETWKWNFRHPLLPRDITIKTEMDQDVFFELLKNIFGITFK